MDLPVRINPDGKWDNSSLPASELVRLYPNPASSKLNILWLGDQTKAGPMELFIYDVYGRTVLDQTIDFSEQGLHTLELDQLVHGLYLVVLSQDQGIVSRNRLVLVR